MTGLVNIDMDVLRTFVTGIDLGSFAKAADRLGRSPSAISLQLRKLENQIGQPLVHKQGRGLVMTEAGEILIGYARRILDLNDEARTVLRGLAELEGWVRVGLPQDFAETWLPGLLARYERAHPKVRVEARVERGSALLEAVQAGKLDFALTWGRLDSPQCDVVAKRKIVWIGPESFQRDPKAALPLIAFDAPCEFRKAAVNAMEAQGIEWRHAFASPSLAGIWAAVTAGLGVTARTAEGKPAHLHVLDAGKAGLPELGTIELAVHAKPEAMTTAAQELRTLLQEAVIHRAD
ncbi:DNA-binding transcriptional LysR family regulator [Rhizobium subbaraonis]|uniref:DNA-binding transcriptional LysR family regulator n=1 Tax=Rhizobium subbaraonis TaxID=908946 RepID=A0A285ULI7_9HYPH|nr:LysR substrate-binding domain-containing protein [Rhizobium subbaraonis]SOC42755.1 DNA-binding transcriptional LysR family regulator [Rhizobium subbaraonis]